MSWAIEEMRAKLDRTYPPEQMCLCGTVVSPEPLLEGEMLRCSFCPEEG